jgi:hypothetical protein
MSFTDRLVLWLHIGFAIFTIGPVTLAISSTPRYIRKRDVAILRYLARITLIFTTASLLVLVFGVILGQLDHDFSRPWLTAALTLFLVAIVLLALIIRDQRKAIRALAPIEVAARQAATAPGPDASTGPDTEGTVPASAAGTVPASAAGTVPASAAGTVPAGPAGTVPAGAAGTVPASGDGTGPASPQAGQQPAGIVTLAAHIASVERGRIAAMGGVVNLLWLVILVLMVWRP